MGIAVLQHFALTILAGSTYNYMFNQMLVPNMTYVQMDISICMCWFHNKIFVPNLV